MLTNVAPHHNVSNDVFNASCAPENFDYPDKTNFVNIKL